jgi:hypothetical protein
MKNVTLKVKIKDLKDEWKESREWKPGKNNKTGFYRYLRAVYKLHAELRKTKGAAKKARGKAKVFLQVPAAGVHDVHAHPLHGFCSEPSMMLLNGNRGDSLQAKSEGRNA